MQPPSYHAREDGLARRRLEDHPAAEARRPSRDKAGEAREQLAQAHGDLQAGEGRAEARVTACGIAELPATSARLHRIRRRKPFGIPVRGGQIEP
jgi:hypothetical protein